MRIDEQLKHQLARELCAILDGWTLSQAVGLMDVSAARISELRHGKLAGYSIGRLVRFIAAHGYDIEIVLRPRQLPKVTRSAPTGTVVRHDRLGRPTTKS